MYVIFPTHVSTKEPILFHAFVPSQKKVRHYVTFHNTVQWFANIINPFMVRRLFKQGLSPMFEQVATVSLSLSLKRLLYVPQISPTDRVLNRTLALKHIFNLWIIEFGQVLRYPAITQTEKLSFIFHTRLWF